MEDITFEVKKGVNEMIVGFTLTAIGETNAEAFCISFPKAQQIGRAEILIEDNEIIFIHRGILMEEAEEQLSVWGFSDGGEFRAKISPKEGEQFSQLFELSGLYGDCEIRVKYEFSWRKGFTLYVKPKFGQVVIGNQGAETPENCPARLPSDYYSPEK